MEIPLQIGWEKTRGGWGCFVESDSNSHALKLPQQMNDSVGKRAYFEGDIGVNGAGGRRSALWKVTDGIHHALKLDSR